MLVVANEQNKLIRVLKVLCAFFRSCVSFLRVYDWRVTWVFHGSQEGQRNAQSACSLPLHRMCAYARDVCTWFLYQQLVLVSGSPIPKYFVTRSCLRDNIVALWLWGKEFRGQVLLRQCIALTTNGRNLCSCSATSFVMFWWVDRGQCLWQREPDWCFAVFELPWCCTWGGGRADHVGHARQELHTLYDQYFAFALIGTNMSTQNDGFNMGQIANTNDGDQNFGTGRPRSWASFIVRCEKYTHERF